METNHYELVWQITNDEYWRATCACGWYDPEKLVSKIRAQWSYNAHINNVYLKGE